MRDAASRPPACLSHPPRTSGQGFDQPAQTELGETGSGLGQPEQRPESPITVFDSQTLPAQRLGFEATASEEA